MDIDVDDADWLDGLSRHPSPVFSTEDSDYAFAMDTASTTTSRINKFDGTNFHTWKFKMRMSRADSLTWELVTARLLHEDMKRKEQGGGADGTAHGQGFMTSDTKRKGKQTTWSGRSRNERMLRKLKRTAMEYMKNYKKISPVDVHLADGGVVQAVGTGDIVMSLSRNLFSVGRFTKDVGPVIFESDGCFAETKGLKWKLGARSQRGHHVVPLAPSTWHIGHGGLDAIVKKDYVIGINMKSVKQWEAYDGCSVGKQTRMSFTKSSPNRAKDMLEVIHSDVCGPMKTPTFGGKRYFVTFIDEKSHFCVVYLMRNKSEVVTKFADLLLECHGKFCADRGIVQKFTPPYTPQLNGVADHEKAYRFEELDSGRVFVTRDAQFMEDVFDGGRREYTS
ncbi:Integrase, catalytic core protein, partial [Phytophthora megakarya]